jgi:hypothetical protein
MNYGQFREELVPHMSDVVFYPDSLDLFDAYIYSGLTYFKLDKDIHEKCKVETRWSCFKEHYNSKEIRDIRNRETLINIGNSLINECNIIGGFSHIKKTCTIKKYAVVGTHVAPGYTHYKPNNSEKHFMTSTLEVWEKEKVTERLLGKHNFVVFESDSKIECESFISYTYTKLFRFLVSLAIDMFAIWDSNEAFRFVPAPPSGKYDHIYTDEELYKAFNLPQKYIDVIEAVIKERKMTI